MALSKEARLEMIRAIAHKLDKIDTLPTLTPIEKRKRGRPSKQRHVVETIERAIENGEEDKYGFNRLVDDYGTIGATDEDIIEERKNLRTTL